MYVLILALLLSAGAWSIRQGVVRHQRSKIVVGAAILAATIGLFGLMSLSGEMLWFQAINLERRFWLFIGVQFGAVLTGALLAGALAMAVVRQLQNRSLRHAALAVAALGGGFWGGQRWDDALVFLYRVAAGETEPVFGLDTGFFLFALPFFELLQGLALFAALVGLAAGAAALALRARQTAFDILEERGDRAFQPLLAGSALLALALAAGHVLDGLRLVHSDLGVVHGAGWTDIHIRLPAYFGMAVLLVILGALPLLPAFRRAVSRQLARITSLQAPALNALGAAWAGLGIAWVAALVVLPGLTQRLVVEPNEITYERPYIQRNIDFTLRGFSLDRVEERQFPASERLTQAILADNQDLLSEVRLWDWRALDAVYKQFQEIRLYYEFDDVDIDRYSFGGRYRQVMVSARELDQDNLARQSQTFVNRRFKYTHGYGMTMATVSDFTAEGLPNLLVKDIPPLSSHPELEVRRPEIYYGELTRGPVVVNSDEMEFDYPSGEQNRYTHYQGAGGVAIDSLWRKIIFGWKFDGARLLFSTYPRDGSRIMFHRQVRERVQRVAPFLEFDEDPYIVLADGRLYWIIDGYTTSRHYPYSEPFSSREVVQYRDNSRAVGFGRRTAVDLHGVNYLRNSVKAVVDAYEGSVDLYVFEPRDPIIRVWQRALPGMFKPREAMPAALRDHVRYPQDYLLAQGLVYAKYHMRDPEVFYNQEDLWVRATEKHYDRVQPVEPYYVMWEQPGSDEAEFVLIQPFTPKNRQVLIGWIAGMCDGDNYGRFLAYKFPKEKRILGPQQVETKIDQDSFLSGQLTLWDQRGSNVIRGNVLAIPLDETLVYVEPIYLRAETAAYPELRLVVVMHGDTMSYAERFDQALARLFGERPAQADVPGGLATGELGQRLDQAFNAYLEALGNKEFDRAASQLQRLSDLIGQAVDSGAGVAPERPGTD